MNVAPIMDVVMTPIVYPAAHVLNLVRRFGVRRMPLARRALLSVGVFPIRNHYYEPQFDFRGSSKDTREERSLPGIDWNVAGQLETLARFIYSGELAGTPMNQTSKREFHFNNSTFGSGDAEYWYQLIRAFKPKQVIEIGSGNSTLMAIKALRRNRLEDSAYACEHVCIEPYEMPWLEQTEVSLVRTKVEDLPTNYFSSLGENDVLFIDSSHVIRPHGDILFELLQLLPTLAKGVIVHFHDIFSPRNYPKWVQDEVIFWNEQYLLEAFLSNNRDWNVLGGVNYLHHNHYEKLKAAAPFLTPEREPGSFYIQKVR